MDQGRYVSPPVAFGAWLLTQTGRPGFVGALAVAATADRKFPKAGDPQAVLAYLRGAMAGGDMFDAVEDAEADWRAHVAA